MIAIDTNEVKIMFFKKLSTEKVNKNLTKKIKKHLAVTLHNKGINFTRIDVDIMPEKLFIELILS